MILIVKMGWGSACPQNRCGLASCRALCCQYEAHFRDLVAEVQAGYPMISPLAKWSGWDLMGLKGMWDLEKVLTLEMLMVSAFSVDGGSHHFLIQNVPVL